MLHVSFFEHFDIDKTVSWQKLNMLAVIFSPPFTLVSEVAKYCNFAVNAVIKRYWYLTGFHVKADLPWYRLTCFFTAEYIRSVYERYLTRAGSASLEKLANNLPGNLLHKQCHLKLIIKHWARQTTNPWEDPLYFLWTEVHLFGVTRKHGFLRDFISSW